MTIDIEFRRGGRIVGATVEVATDSLTTLRELALQLMRMTHSTDVRVCVGDR